MASIVHVTKQMTTPAVDAVRRFESELDKAPQMPLETHHAFHAGMYARTITLHKGLVMTGVQLRVPTVLVVSGDIIIYGEDGPERFTGYHVLLGKIGRKQAFYAQQDTAMTMIYPTKKTTVAGVESEFTLEEDKLVSRRQSSVNAVSGGK